MSEPFETLVVTFFETPVLAVRIADGTILLSVRDVCTATGVNHASQLRRLRADPDLRDGLHRLRVMTGGGSQQQVFLILEFVPAWISTIDRARAAPVVQERLRYLRLFAIREVYQAITRTAGLPEGPSRTIEDLDDLQRFDEAMRGIAERQRALEDSQEKARQAWRDHEERLRRLEDQRTQEQVLSHAQRGHIYQLVRLWAQARVDQEQISAAEAFASCWAAVKTRYQVAKYEHIPAQHYEDCVRFIRTTYERQLGAPLTGEQLRFLGVDDEQP